MNKKGFAFPFIFVMKVILAVAALIFIAGFFNNLYTMVTGGSAEDSASLAATKAFVEAVQEFVEEDGDYAYTDEFLFLSSDHTLVGFNYDRDNAYSGFGKIERPPQPYCEGGKACICLYNSKIRKTEGEPLKNLVRCWKIDKDITFISGDVIRTSGHTNNYGEIYGEFHRDFSNLPDAFQQEYTFLVLYGDFYSRDIYSTGGQQVYIEKTKREGDILLFIGRMADSTKYRYKYLSQCSAEFSDEDCRGAYADQMLPAQTSQSYYCRQVSGTDRCVKEEVAQCRRNGKIDGLCACGDRVYGSGYCFENERIMHSPINCLRINSCEDYCNQDNNILCHGSEKDNCQMNACQLYLSDDCRIVLGASLDRSCEARGVPS